MTSRPTPTRAVDTTQDNPWSLATLAANIKGYIDKLPELWVQGQVVEYRPRPGTRMAFFTIRDLEQQVSVTVKAWPGVIPAAGPGFEEGAKVVLKCKPDFYEGTGQFALLSSQVHTVGIGDLLARIEVLRKQLATEGLFEAARKKPLPFLPRRIGLICGRGAKAEQDVLVNARLRWPGAIFEVREVAVQGDHCVSQVGQALLELDSINDIDVIVIARGGGAVEDLLPFSDERLVRAASRAQTPLVSAIGHESDCPLLDLVADYRASTPTDAARRIVPDLAEELAMLDQARDRLRMTVLGVLDREYETIKNIHQRPVMASPASILTIHEEKIAALSSTLRLLASARVDRESGDLAAALQGLRALSPTSVLERGYSILRLPSGQVISSTDQVKKGDFMEAILHSGRLVAQVSGTTTANRKDTND